MTIEAGQDASGPWASISCDAIGCERHLAVRPGGEDYDDLTMVDLVDELREWSVAEGWSSDGQSESCDLHRRQRVKGDLRSATQSRTLDARQAGLGHA